MFTSRFFNTDPFSQRAAPSIFDTDPFFGRTQQQQQSRLQQQHQRDESDEKYNSPASTNTTTTSTAPTTSTTNTPNKGVSQQQQPHQQQLRRRVVDEDQWMSSPFAMSDAPFDRYFDRQFGRMNAMMRHLDDRMFDIEENQPTAGGSSSPSSSAYSVSSSSYHHTGADGKPIDSHSTRNERHRVGDLLEENSHYSDHLGNERSKTKRGIANQMREVIRDRNSHGEERKVENLKGINHDQVEQFDQRWQQEKKKLEEEQKIRFNQQPTLGAGSQQQQQQQRLNAGTSGNVSTSKVESDKNQKVGHEEKKIGSPQQVKSNVDAKTNSTTAGVDSTSRINRAA